MEPVGTAARRKKKTLQRLHEKKKKHNKYPFLNSIPFFKGLAGWEGAGRAGQGGALAVQS